MVRLAGRVALVILLLTSTAEADIGDYVGKLLADVRVELGGQPFSEPAVLELIQTRVGQPLRLEQIRESIDHLIGLGRFEDVRVYAEASTTRPGAVSVRWVLAAVQRIGRIDITGHVELDSSTMRTQLLDRVGVRPSTVRLQEMIEALGDYYRDRGYRSARIDPQIVPTSVPELVTLTLTIDAGPRTRIGRVNINGEPPIPDAQLIARLQLESGRPYDAVAITARIDGYEEQLRGQGYYEASVDSTAAFAETGSSADLTVTVEPGPRVRVVFAGDPLPENRREALVPIREERSVDLDLLEDASRKIEQFLRQQGYRNAQAPYAREQHSGEMVLTFTVARGPLHTLERAEIAGNQALSQNDLAALMQLKPGEPFVDSRVAAVASAITELYRVRGYARASVKPEVTVPPTVREVVPVSVRFLITEGPQTIVGAVTVQGASGVPESRITPLLTLTSGKPFYRPELDADRDAIERLYRNEGFQSIRVTPESSLADEGRRVDVQWVVREGVQTLVDHLLVTGNVHTSGDLIRREMALQPGRPLGEDAIADSQRRLAALGLFRRVRIVEVPHGINQNHDVLVDVEEAPATSISEGGGVEVVPRLRRAVVGGRAEGRFEVAPRGFFEITRRNLWGKNRSLSLFTRVSFRPRDPAIDSTDPTDQGGYGFNEYRVVGTLREPRPFDKPGEAQFTAFLEQAVRSSFNFSRRGGRAEYARRIGTAFTASGRYTFDYTKLFDEQILPGERLLVDRLFPQVRLSTLTGSVLRDTRNDVLDPERGVVLGVDGSVAPRFAGSEVGFARAFLQGSGYRRLPGASRFVLAGAAKLGVAMGFERRVPQLDANGQPVIGADGQPVVDIVKDLPASERFFAGGDTTVRGFVLDQLGAADTLDNQGFPTGGNALVVLNLELRTPYWKGLGPVAFVDAGNVFKRAGNLSLLDLRPAAGVGLRYRSPLGPLRFDFGFNLDPQVRGGTRERRSVFHISLGQAF